MNDGEEENETVRASRLRILATRVLGYTHTEAGLRPMHRLLEELGEDAEMKTRKPTVGDDGYWIDEEAI